MKSNCCFMKAFSKIPALLLVSVFLISSADCFAQRLVSGQKSVFVEGTAVATPGAGIGFSSLKRYHKWDLGVQGRFFNKGLSLDPTEEYPTASDFEVAYKDIYASVMYKYMFTANRSRSWSLWGGISFDAGARLRSAKFDYPDKDRLPGSAFIFGFTPEICVEFFPGNNFSMTLFGRPRLSFRGEKASLKEPWFYPEAGLRLNFYFFVR